MYGKIRNYFETNNLHICDTNFTSDVEVVLVIEEEKKEHFHKDVTEITGGKAEVVFDQKVYAYFDEQGNYLKQ